MPPAQIPAQRRPNSDMVAKVHLAFCLAAPFRVVGVVTLAGETICDDGVLLHGG